MVDIYANTIWIDEKYWLAAFIIVSLAIHIPTTRGMGPADFFAMGFGSIIATAVLFTAVVWVFSFFGHPLGIAG